MPRRAGILPAGEFGKCAIDEVLCSRRASRKRAQLQEMGRSATNFQWYQEIEAFADSSDETIALKWR